ncbi:MAG TPA: hypothetical protein VGP13_04145 [Candidatus Paceibacterota bacterium]|jgi:hypothetical protein|nr:hypothetical protein [Candidatus Paceibacterota bacterium]
MTQSAHADTLPAAGPTVHSGFSGQVLLVLAAAVLLATSGFTLGALGYPTVACIVVASELALALLIMYAYTGKEDYIGISWLVSFFLVLGVGATAENSMKWEFVSAVGFVFAANLVASGVLRLRQAKS